MSPSHDIDNLVFRQLHRGYLKYVLGLFFISFFRLAIVAWLWWFVVPVHELTTGADALGRTLMALYVMSELLSFFIRLRDARRARFLKEEARPW
jgi:hypothetical protein